MKYQWAYKVFSALLIVILALAAFPVKPVYAAAAELNAWTLAASTGASGNNATINAGNLTVSGGTNRLFVAAVCMELSGGNTMAALGISLGGTALTQIGTTGGTNMTEQCWMGYLLNSQIPAGSNALTVPYDVSGGGTTVTGAHVYWASYSGIDQTTPINDSNANSNGAANVTFGQQIDFRQDGVTFYIAANIGTPATMGAIATFTQQLVTISNGHSSFINRITTVPHAANGNYAGATNVTFGGTTGARSSVVVASLRPFVGETTPGTATATTASNVAIDVSMPYTNDSNANNTYTVQYCLTSANCAVSGLWSNWVTGAAHSASPYNTTITGLSPATSYDVRVTYNDTDGFLGGGPQVQTITNVVTDACGPSLTYTVPAGTNRVVVVAISNEGGGGGSTISNVQIDGGAATQIDSITNNNAGGPARLYVGYRVFGTSAVPQIINITANNGECIYANTYSNINQTTGTGTNNTINDIENGTANSGTTTTSATVTNQAGGRVIYAINMNNNGAVSTGTSGVWTFTELFDGNETGDGNRTAVGESTTTTAGSATISVGDGGSAHNRSVLIAFSLNPIINSTTVGVATATAASSSAIDVSMPYTHDNNANNTYTVEYCLTSANCSVSGSWINWVTNAAHTASPYTTQITGLTPSTSYDIRVTYNDIDGVNGTNPQIISATTLAPPSEMDVQGNGISIADGDGSPSLTDFTDFGNVPENFSVDRTFTIFNTGAGNLILGAINFIGGDNGDFSVVTPPTSPVPPGGSTTFTVRLTAGNGGGATRNTNIVIPNNDPNEAPYNFEIQGTRFNAEANVQGLGNNIASGFLPLPVFTNCTRFPDTGLTGFADCTYTIQNLSATNVLYIDTITFTGGTPGDFSVITPPSSNVAANGSTTFTVRFTPSAIGVRGTLLSFVNNDSNESPYFFPIRGDGTANTPPTVTTPIADVVVLEDAANTVFSLYPNFQDAENADPLLTYTITGNTNPGLFTSVSIVDPTNFTLDYAPDANGTSNITIRATDTGGLFVEDTFQVTVTAVNDEPSFSASTPPTVNEDAGIQSISNWASVVSFGATNESGQAVLAYPVSNLSASCATLLSTGPTVNAAGTLSYTPALDANGTCTFDVAVQDNGGIANGGDDTSPTQNFTITVTAVNDEPNFTAVNPPTALEDAGLQTVTGWVTAVDFGPADEDSSQAVLSYIISGSTCGSLLTADPVVNNAGDLSYTPITDQNGTCTFDVQVQDDGGTANGGDDTSPVQNFTITVTAVNDEPNFTAVNPPTALEDAGLQTVIGWVTSVDFGPADEDSSQAVLQYIVSGSTCGTLLTADPSVNNAGDLSYTPVADQNGTCTFDVAVQDDGGTANSGDDTSPTQTFTITVTLVNDEPNFTAVNPPTVLEDAGLQTITGWATFDPGPADESGQSVLVYTVSNSTCGTLLTADPVVNNTGDLSYTPVTDQNGTCTFDVVVQDDGGIANGGDDTSPTQTFTITVTAVNDEPNFTASNPPAVVEDAGLQTVTGWITAVDFGPTDEDSSQAVLQYIVSNSTCGTLLTADPSVNNAGDLSYTPATNQNGTCTFDVQVQDDGGTTNGGDDTSPTQTFTITVGTVNDEPSFTASNPPTILEDAGLQTVTGWVTAVNFGPPDESGQAVLQYIVSGSTCGTLLTADPVVSNAGDLSYTPVADQNGTCTFDVAVQDNGGTANGGDDTSPTQSFTITVTAVNDEPNFTASNPSAVLEDAGLQTLNGWATFSAGPTNESGQSVLGYTVSNSTCGTLLTADPVVNNAGDLSYTPALNQNGTCTFDVVVQDNGGTANGGDDTSPVQNFTITVNTVNDEPSFTASNPSTILEDAGLQTINSWATFNPGPANESGQTVSQYIISASTCGTLLASGPTVNTTGTLTYTPAANQNGTCTFDVAVQDNGGIANGGDDTSPTQNFSITVTAVNDEPNFTASNPAAVLENAGTQTNIPFVTAVDFGPADEDSSQSVLGYIVSGSTCGTLLTAAPTVNNAGQITYTPATDQNGTCTFNLQVQDDGGTANGGDDTSPTQNFTITVTSVNDEPNFTASNPPAVYEDAGPQSILNWAIPDFGPADEDGTQAVVGYTVSNSTCGTLLSAGPLVSNAGTLTYTPATDQDGTCTFDVTLQDNGGTANGGDDTSQTQNFTITITPQIGITASIVANDKVYDGDNTATFTCSLTGVVPPDVVTCTGGTATFNDKNVSTGKLVTAVGLGITGADAFKYELTSTSATDNADITQRTLNVTATGIDKVYDGNTNATVTLSDDRFLGDLLTVSYTSAAFVSPNVGTNITINVSGISITGGADQGNYVLGNTTAVTDADITITGQTITVTVNAPSSAANGSSFNVAATASSGLPVTITVSGVCSATDVDGSTTDGDAAVTMTSGTGTCSVFYDQAGDINYTPAPQIQEDVNATESPIFTSAANTSFDLGFLSTFNITATGNPSTMTITVTGTLPSGITFTDNGDGTATLSGTPGTGTAGVYPLVLTANNGVNPNGTQNFTLTVRNGPSVNTTNSNPDTGNGSISENESVLNTLNITQLLVTFDRNVYDPAGDTDPDDVTNPANYILVRSATGTFATVDCAGGAVAPDVTIAVDSVTYDNITFTATLNINGGLPINVNGFYRLYVCGTTSIVDATNPLLTLAGNGIDPGTDFTRTFQITDPAQSGGGGNNGGGNTSTTNLSGVLIPTTGFTPNQVTKLPAQSVGKAYTASKLRIEIPSLSMDLPIVGIALKDKQFDVTWLGSNAGYLEGSAYPTWQGNSILTGHVTDANGKPGPFAYVNELKIGDQIYIHNNGFTYVYEVRESKLVLPNKINDLFKHEEDYWLTLVTCENFNAKSEEFTHRRIVRAVLISIIPEK